MKQLYKKYEDDFIDFKKKLCDELIKEFENIGCVLLEYYVYYKDVKFTTFDRFLFNRNGILYSITFTVNGNSKCNDFLFNDMQSIQKKISTIEDTDMERRGLHSLGYNETYPDVKKFLSKYENIFRVALLVPSNELNRHIPKGVEFFDHRRKSKINSILNDQPKYE